MNHNDISAQVISRPGALGDVSYPALEIHLQGFASPYVLTLSFPAVVYRALAEQVDPVLVYDAIAAAVNDAHRQDGAAARGTAVQAEQPVL